MRDTMKRIFLLRHGSTEANEKALYCGVSDIPLSENGVRVLAEKSEKYKKLVSDKCFYFTSGMKRCEQTLQILFGSDGKEVVHTVDTGFAEINFGIFEMKSYEELKENAEYLQWITGDNFSNPIPCGESGTEMTERVLSSFEKLNAFALESDGDCVLVCHGGVIAAIMNHLFLDEHKNRYDWQPHAGCGYILTRTDHSSDFNQNPVWKYEELN